jgi:Protein of unknown function (DUF3455)
MHWVMVNSFWFFISFQLSINHYLFTTNNSYMNKIIFCLLNISMLSFIFELGINNAIAQQAVTSVSQVPNNLQVPNQQNPILKVVAVGSQIYVCKAKADNPQVFEWTLKAPQAKLFDEKWQTLGSHYAGPTWEANDGSKIIGQVKTKANAPQDTAIPWLLLEVKSHAGNGILSQVNWIQRLHTVGGKAPEQGCDRQNENQEISVGYKADYYFYR